MRKLFYLLVGIGLFAASCDDYDDTDLMNRVDDLDNRVSELEETIAQMNQDIKGVQTLVNALEDNVYIAKIEPQTEGYKIYFTNGEEITISDGKKGDAGQDGVDAPKMTIKLDPADGEYYWALEKDGQVDYILADGKKIPVKGEQGKTPLLRVKKEGSTGFWEVSYDNGQTWNRVLDADGQPVTTSGGAGGLFTSAEVVTAPDGSKKAVFTLLNGDTIEIELRSELYILFKAGAPEGDVALAYGTSKEFEMEAVGVLKTVVTKPDGWKASYNETTNKLTVSAPVLAIKDYAETSGEVNLIYFGKENQSSVLTLNVLIGEFVTIEPAAQTVSATGVAGTYSVPFTADGVVTAELENPADASWLSATVDMVSTALLAEPATPQSKINIVVKENKGAERVGKVLVKAKHNTVTITVEQEAGLALQAMGMRPKSGVKKWNVTFEAAGLAAADKSPSIAVLGEYVLVNVKGKNPVILKAETGEKVGEFDLQGAPNQIITADDAGHIVLCNYGNASTPFEIWRAKDINSKPEKMGTYAGNPIGNKISVVGDVYGDGLFSLPYSQWTAGGVTVYWTWEVKGGALVGAKPAWKKMDAKVIKPWQSNIDMVAADINPASDFFFVGYSGSTLHWMNSKHEVVAKLGIVADAYLGNFISNAVDTEVFNKQLYVAMTCDNLYGNDNMWVIEATASKWTGNLSASPAVAYSLPLDYNINDGSYGQDVQLRVAPDGVHMYAYYAFGGSTVGCVEFDCLDK